MTGSWTPAEVDVRSAVIPPGDATSEELARDSRGPSELGVKAVGFKMAGDELERFDVERAEGTAKDEGSFTDDGSWAEDFETGVALVEVAGFEVLLEELWGKFEVVLGEPWECFELVLYKLLLGSFAVMLAELRGSFEVMLEVGQDDTELYGFPAVCVGVQGASAPSHATFPSTTERLSQWLVFAPALGLHSDLSIDNAKDTTRIKYKDNLDDEKISMPIQCQVIHIYKNDLCGV